VSGVSGQVSIIGMALTDFDPANGQNGADPDNITEFQVEVTSVTGETGLLTAYQGKVLTLIKNNYIQPSGIGTDGVGLTLTEDGKILSTRDLDMGGNSISNVKSIGSASGNWSIDESGYITAKEVTADAYNVDARKKGEADATVGEATFTAGMDEILVTNNRVKANSKIFVTFFGNPGTTWWVSERADGWFKVKLAISTSSDLTFSYWIIGVIEDSAPAAAPAPVVEAAAIEPTPETPTSTPPIIEPAPEAPTSTPIIVETPTTTPEVPPAETATTTP